jgi:hypothetical protein
MTATAKIFMKGGGEGARADRGPRRSGATVAEGVREDNKFEGRAGARGCRRLSPFVAPAARSGPIRRRYHTFFFRKILLRKFRTCNKPGFPGSDGGSVELDLVRLTGICGYPVVFGTRSHSGRQSN